MNNFCYHVLLAVHPTTGVPIQTALDSIPGKPFGNQDSKSQDGKYIVIDCGSSDSVSTYPELAGYIDSSYDAYVTAVCTTPENSSHADARALINTIGASGSFWSAPLAV